MGVAVGRGRQTLVAVGVGVGVSVGIGVGVGVGVGATTVKAAGNSLELPSGLITSTLHTPGSASAILKEHCILLPAA